MQRRAWTLQNTAGGQARKRLAAQSTSVERTDNGRRHSAAETRDAASQAALSALERSLSAFTDDIDIDAFLKDQLRVSAETFGYSSATMWTIDAAAMTTTLLLVFEDGLVVDAAASRHPLAGRAIPLNGDDESWRSIRAGRPYLMHAVGFGDSDDASSGTAVDAYLRKAGIKGLFCLPLRVGGRILASMVFRLTSLEHPSDEQVRLAMALANQSALALQLARIANAERERAVAQEHANTATRRAATLARANAAMRANLDGLAAMGDLEAFLAKSIVTCAHEMSAVGVGIWKNREDGIHELLISFEDGQVQPKEKSRNPAPNSSPRDRHEEAAHLSARQIVVHSGEALTTAWWYPQLRDYLESRGIIAIASVPMFVADKWIGTIVLRYVEEPVFSDETRELAFALANQVALALEITRLSEIARDVALANEREAAANIRSKELVRANSALAESTSKISAAGDLETFLGEMLTILLEHMESASGSFWLVDDEGWYRLHSEVINGQTIVQDGGKHPGKVAPPIAAGREAAMKEHERQAIERAVSVYADVANEPAYDGDEANRAYLLSQGVRSQVIVPLFAGNRHLGSFSVRYQTKRVPTSAQIELAQALGNQAALALEMDRLAKQARTAAVAIGRVDSLMRANEAMHRSIATGSAELDVLLGRVLSTIVERLGEQDGDIWLFDEEKDRYTLRLSFEDGRLRYRANASVSGASVSASSSARNVFRAVDHAARARTARGESPTFDGPERIATDPGYAPYRALFAERGIRSVFSIPLFAGERWLGNISIRSGRETPFAPEDAAFAQALANQASLALHLARLAEEAREAAVSREREIAARQRAEQLSQANMILRQSAENLGAIDDIDHFLGQALLSVCTLVGGDSATVWTEDYERKCAVLRHVVEDGKAVPAALSKHPNAVAPRPTPAGATEAMPGFGTERARPHQVIIAHSPDITPDERAYFDALGVRSLLSVPIVFSKRHIGDFTIRLRDERPVMDEDTELIHALASQVAVALHLTTIAAEAREAAIAREREVAAQDRAKRLSAANALLRQSAENLGAIDDIDDFLGQALLTVCSLLGGTSATIWTLDRTRTVAVLRHVVENGKVVPSHLSNHPNATTPRAMTGDNGTPDFGTAGARPHQTIVETDRYLTPDEKRYLGALGIRSLVAVPIVFSDQHIGDFTIRLSDERPVLAEDAELVQALANQVAVALHLTALVEDAQKRAELLAITEERQRIARDVHDGIAQSFTSILMQAEAAELSIGREPEKVRAGLNRAQSLARLGIAESRRLAAALRPEAPESADFLARINDVVQATVGTVMPAVLEVKGDPWPVAPDVSLQLQLIAREALANAQRYSRADLLRVAITYRKETIQLEIADDGVGLDPGHAAEGGAGFTNMHARATRIGATLTIASAPNGGVRVTVVAPARRYAEPTRA